MIVNPDKGLFFVATALMCSVSLYAAELSTAEPDPMTRVFVGEPSRLTLPPDFPATEVAGEEGCLVTAGLGKSGTLERGAESVRNDSCDPIRPEPAAAAITLPRALDAASAKSEIPAQAMSVGSTDRIH